MKKVLLLISALVLAVALTLPIAMPAMAHTNPMLRVALIAGQNLQIGYVDVWNDTENLYVEFWIFPENSGWLLMKTDLHVATSFEDIPQNKNGNPKVGHFDHSEKHGSGVTAYTYTIGLGDWDAGTKLYIAAHADVVFCFDSICCEETAWGGCCNGQIPFPGRNWAMYFVYWVQ